MYILKSFNTNFHKWFTSHTQNQHKQQRYQKLYHQKLDFHDFTKSGFRSMRLNYLTKYCEPPTMSNLKNKNCNCH